MPAVGWKGAGARVGDRERAERRGGLVGGRAVDPWGTSRGIGG